MGLEAKGEAPLRETGGAGNRWGRLGQDIQVAKQVLKGFEGFLSCFGFSLAPKRHKIGPSYPDWCSVASRMKLCCMFHPFPVVWAARLKEKQHFWTEF